MENPQLGFDLILPLSKVVNLGKSRLSFNIFNSLLKPEFSRLKTEVTDCHED